MTTSGDEWGYTRGFAYKKGSLYLLAYARSLERQGIELSQVFSFTGSWATFPIPWAASLICLVDGPKPVLLCISREGRVFAADNDGFSEETVDDSQDGPAFRGDLRAVRQIGGDVYVAGMGRQVYRRIEPGRWARCDNGVVVAPADAIVCGFNAIDGAGRQNLYAAGWGGEIWHFDGEAWRKHEVPTNLKLQCLQYVGAELVYACGQSGVLLRGRGSEWVAIPQELTRSEFWGLEWFQGTIWAATKDGIYRLEAGDQLIRVDIGMPGQLVTSGWLHADGDVMWSIGDRHLFSTTDGVRWIEHFPSPAGMAQ